jgi:hypothetical protein
LFPEGNAIFFITIPVFLPIAAQYGLDLINFGVVMTLLIMIGNLTPPVGMAFSRLEFQQDRRMGVGQGVLALYCRHPRRYDLDRLRAADIDMAARSSYGK